MTAPHSNHLDVSNAQAAVDTFEAHRRASWAQSVYPRWFALAYSLWAGLLAATVTQAFWLPLFFSGLGGYTWWRRGRPTWVSETPSRSAFGVAVFAGLLIGGVFIAGYLAKVEGGLHWAPWVAGLVVAVSVYGLAHRAYGEVWRQRAEG